MKLLVVSHPCVTPVNQSFFADVQSLTKWDLTIVIPALWKTEYKKAPLAPLKWGSLQAKLRIVPVMFSGNIPLHLYKDPLVGYLRQLNPDVIYVHNEPYALSTSQFFAANRLVGRRPIGFYTAQNICKTYPFPFKSLESWVFRRSDFSFPVTESALAVARGKGYSGSAVVLPLALDTSVYYPKLDLAQKKRCELKISRDDTVIGFMGRLVMEKGIETLIQSLPILGTRPYRCLIVGSGPDEARLRELVAKNHLQDKVIFTGYVSHDEAALWLTLFDICVLPSRTTPNWKEQFGRVVLESLACGTPVVGSDSGEIPSLLRKTGAEDAIFPEGNAEALSNVLIKLCDNPAAREKLGSVGGAVVRNQFNQQHLASRFASSIEFESTRKSITRL